MMNRMADQKDIDIKQSAADQELSAFLTSGGTLQLEWLPSDEAVSKNTALLQREIHKRYLDDPVAWLLFLGFCDRAIALSPSRMNATRSLGPIPRASRIGLGIVT